MRGSGRRWEGGKKKCFEGLRRLESDPGGVVGLENYHTLLGVIVVVSDACLRHQKALNEWEGIRLAEKGSWSVVNTMANLDQGPWELFLRSVTLKSDTDSSVAERNGTNQQTLKDAGDVSLEAAVVTRSLDWWLGEDKAELIVSDTAGPSCPRGFLGSKFTNHHRLGIRIKLERRSYLQPGVQL